MLNTLFIITPQGLVVTEKHWREPISRHLCDAFVAHQAATETPEKPVFEYGENTALFIRRNGLYLVGVVTFDVLPLLVFELLGRLADNLEEYVGELSESSLRDNFLTVSQVLDEMFDYGVPLHLEPNVLQDIVMPPGKLKSMVASVTGKSQVSEQLPSAAMGAPPWRRDGVRYASNEVLSIAQHGMA